METEKVIRADLLKWEELFMQRETNISSRIKKLMADHEAKIEAMRSRIDEEKDKRRKAELESMNTQLKLHKELAELKAKLKLKELARED